MRLGDVSTRRRVFTSAAAALDAARTGVGRLARRARLLPFPRVRQVLPRRTSRPPASNSIPTTGPSGWPPSPALSVRRTQRAAARSGRAPRARGRRAPQKSAGDMGMKDSQSPVLLWGAIMSDSWREHSSFRSESTAGRPAVGLAGRNLSFAVAIRTGGSVATGAVAEAGRAFLDLLDCHIDFDAPPGAAQAAAAAAARDFPALTSDPVPLCSLRRRSQGSYTDVQPARSTGPCARPAVREGRLQFG